MSILQMSQLKDRRLDRLPEVKQWADCREDLNPGSLALDLTHFSTALHPHEGNRRKIKDVDIVVAFRKTLRILLNEDEGETSLMVQWLELCSSDAGGTV